MSGEIRLPIDLAATLDDWARDGYPQESCGLLIGRDDPTCRRIHSVARIRNLADSGSPDRFRLDPEGFVACDHAARRSGLDILGVWHTHPRGPSTPSDSDRARLWEGYSYLIAAVTEAGPDSWRSWRAIDDELVEEKLSPSDPIG